MKKEQIDLKKSQKEILNTGNAVIAIYFQIN